MPSRNLGVAEETFLDQKELLIHNKHTVQEELKGRRRLLKTAALSMAFFCLGLCVAIPGPTLLDLGRRVNRDIEHMTFIFTARSVGFLIGSLVGGVLFDFFDQQILLFYTLAVVAVATTGVPWCSALLTLSTLICLQGVAIGVLDTGGNVFCIRIWGKRSAPFMQILHFAFGIGAFLAPLIARPFLMDRDVSNNTAILGYHPVISLVSRSTHNQFIRDLSNQPSRDQDFAPHQNPPNVGLFLFNTSVYILKNDTGQSQINNISSSIMPFYHKNKKMSHWKKKSDEKDQNNLIIFSAKTLNSKVNEPDKGISVYETRSAVPVGIVGKPKKPDFYNGTILSQGYSDTAFIYSKLKEFKRKLQQNKSGNGEAEKFSITSVFHSKYARDLVTKKKHLMRIHSNDADNKDMSNVTIARVKRQNLGGNETDKNNSFGNDTQLQDNMAVGNLSNTPIPSDTNRIKVKKPEVNEATHLSEKGNDGTIIENQLKIMSKQTSLNKPENSEADAVVTTVDYSSNNRTKPTESVDLAKTTSGIIKSAENTTIIPPVTISGRTTTILTTTATTTITTVTEESITVIATTSSSLTASTKIPDTTTTNASKATKPRATGDVIRDLVISLSGMSRVQIAYPVIGFLLAVNSGFFLFLHCKDRLLKSPLYIRRYQDPARNPFTKCFVASVILMLFLFFLVYMGMEVTFGGLLATFAVYYPREPWTPAQGASLTSLFWGCLAIGRGFSIFIARCVKPSNMIVMNLGITVLGALILSFAVPASPAALWIGTVIFGLGMSSLFPTAILWANACYPLSSSATAVFVAGCGVGEMSVPLLTGYLYENVNHMAVMYVILFLSSQLSVLYFSIQMLVYRKGKMSQQKSNSGFVRLKNMEEAEEEEESDLGVVEGISLGIMETTWRRRVQGEEERRGEIGGKKIVEITKLMEM